jgi:hypothetical protein
MEPRMHHAQTADGPSIAIRTLAQNTPFVQMPMLRSSLIQLESQASRTRHWHQVLAQKKWAISIEGGI